MRSLAPDTLVAMAVAAGATTPVPTGGAGSMIWSTSNSAPLVWNGTIWTTMATGAGSGDVAGPAGATDNRVARFDTATGKLIQSSLVTIDDTGALSAAASISSGGGGVEGGIVATTAAGGVGAQFWSTGAAGAFRLVSPDSTVQYYSFSYNGDIQTIYNGAALRFLTDGSIETMRLLQTGKVLIGTTTPGTGIFRVAGQSDLDIMRLTAQASDPATPAAGFGLFYAKTWAGRTVPSWRGPSGVSYALSPHLGENNIRSWRGAATAVATTFASQLGTMPYTGASPTAPTIPALASTNRLTQTRRSTVSTGATAGGLAYIRANQTEVWRGNAAGLGGFLVVHRFALSGTLQTGLRAFAGLVDVVANPTNVDPLTSTTPGGIGIACNAATGNWSLVNNLTGTARTALGLGANFPVNNTDLLEIALWCAPNDSGISYQVTNLSTGNTTSGTLTTNIPANATFLAPTVWVTNNATAVAQTLDFISTYVETDY